MNYQTILSEEFLGCKITVNLENFRFADGDFDWCAELSGNDEEDPLGGSGEVGLDYRPYHSYDSEGEEWKLSTGLSFSVSDEGLIKSIDITAEVSCFGDSGLGDVDPQEVWTDSDLKRAREFLRAVTSLEGVAPENRWVIPCNPKAYNVVGAFSGLTRIPWKQSNRNFRIGDIVYIYVSAPVAAIRFKCRVVSVNLTGDRTIDAAYVRDSKAYANCPRHMVLELICGYNPALITRQVLAQHGITGNIQGPRHLPEETKEFFLRCEF